MSTEALLMLIPTHIFVIGVTVYLFVKVLRSTK